MKILIFILLCGVCLTSCSNSTEISSSEEVSVTEIVSDWSIEMNDYVKILKYDDCVSLAFYIEDDNVMAIGEKLVEIEENAYMNGYNWEALLDCYIELNAPELIDTFETDSEAGMYSAIFEDSDDGNANAEALAKIIISLVENKETLFDFVRSHGDEIVWD